MSLWNYPRLTAALCTVAVLGCAAAPAVFLAAADAASLGRVETVADPYVAPTPTADDYYILRQLAARSRNAESEREQRPAEVLTAPKMYIGASASLQSMQYADSAAAEAAENALRQLAETGAVPAAWAAEALDTAETGESYTDWDGKYYSLDATYCVTDSLGFVTVRRFGMTDNALFTRYSVTMDSRTGTVVEAWLSMAGTRNPVIILDEIDKLGNDFRGDPSSALLEALDPEQNFNFSDHYLNVPFDLSKVLFICTANHLENIPGPLRDRLEIISLPGYTQQEKLAIARKYILPKEMHENGLKDRELTLPDAAMNRIIREYTREAGLRNLEREIGTVCRKIARRKAEGSKPPFRVTAAGLPRLLGAPIFIDDEAERKLIPGVALGLAWTPAGGEILYIEVSAIKGKGGLTLTGQLGDVMKESAQAALTYARAKADELGIAPDFAEHTDIHIHVPAGATPKDGPSAGVTLVTALISALTGKTVRGDICMTGEITQRGRVLPVGGIKEKVLAGVARGIGHVILPAKNQKDLEEIPQELRRKIIVHTVDSIDDVLPLVFEKK